MYTSRARSPYFLNTCLSEPSAWRQYGHWKSEYSTIVIDALSLPRCGWSPVTWPSCERIAGSESAPAADEGTRTQLSSASRRLAPSDPVLSDPAHPGADIRIATPMVAATLKSASVRNLSPLS